LADLTFTILIGGVHQSFLTCLQLGVFVPCGLEGHILVLIFCCSHKVIGTFQMWKTLSLPQGDKSIHEKEIEQNSIEGYLTVGW